MSNAASAVFPTMVGSTKAATKVGEQAVNLLVPEPITPKTPPPPVPASISSAEVRAARSKQREEDLRRSGRRATILTSNRGVQDDLGVSRPQARAATNLGGT